MERRGRGGGERREERKSRRKGQQMERGLEDVSLQRGSIATTDDEGPIASPRTSLGAVHCL